MPVATSSRQNSGGGGASNRELLDGDPLAMSLSRSTRGSRRRAGEAAAAAADSEQLGATQFQSASKQLDSSQSSIMFNQSKDELYTLSNGYKKFQHELKSWKMGVNRDEISLERLLQARLFVTVSPTKKFTGGELEALKRYISPPHSGSVLILLSEGGEAKLNTNINVFLEEFGIKVANLTFSYFKA